MQMIIPTKVFLTLQLILPYLSFILSYLLYNTSQESYCIRRNYIVR